MVCFFFSLLIVFSFQEHTSLSSFWLLLAITARQNERIKILSASPLKTHPAGLWQQIHSRVLEKKRTRERARGTEQKPCWHLYLHSVHTFCEAYAYTSQWLYIQPWVDCLNKRKATTESHIILFLNWDEQRRLMLQSPLKRAEPRFHNLQLHSHHEQSFTFIPIHLSVRQLPCPTQSRNLQSTLHFFLNLPLLNDLLIVS